MSKKSQKDYWNYDYINIIVKSKNAYEVSRSYAIFGWEEIDRVPDKHYIDVLNLSFKRKRRIAQKDRLQFLQVAYEKLINKRSEIEFNLHNKSYFLISISSLIFLVLTFAFLFAVKSLIGIISQVLLCISIVFLTAFSIGAYKLIKSVRKKEKLNGNEQMNKINREIDEILQQVKLIWRNQNEEKI